MGQLTENKVLQTLGLQSFNNISKEKQIELISMLHQMDRDVVLKVLDQSPSIINATVEFGKSLLASNDKSVMASHAALDNIITSLNSVAENENLSAADKLSIVDKMTEIARMQQELTKENHGFLADCLKKVGYIALAGGFLAAGYLGLKNRE